MRTVLFQVHHLYYLPQFLPVAEALLRTGDWAVYFSPVILPDRTDHDLIVRILNEDNLSVITADTEKERVRRILERDFDVTVFGKAAHAEKYCSERTLAVLLYHGIGFKRCYYTDFNPRLNVRYVEGEYRLQELKRYGYEIEYVVTGFPKLDYLEKTDPQEIRNRLQLDPRRPTLLYAPTFYPSSIELISEELARVTQEYNLIVKLHHFSWLLPKYRHQRQLWQSLAIRYSHIRLLPVTEYNIIPYFPVSDLLLTDGSSTAFEFLAVERPVIRIRCQRLRWHHRLWKDRFQRRIDQDIESQLDFAYQIGAPQELPATIEKVLRDEEQKKDLMPIYRQKFLGIVDGRAAERVVADLNARWEH